MDGTRWLNFDDLCVEMQLTPRQVLKLIKAGKIVGLCHGRVSRPRTDWRYVDPAEKYKRALALAARIESRRYAIDLAEFPIISTNEFATLCGFSSDRVRGLIHRKVVQPYKIGKYSFFTANQVRDFIYRRSQQQHAYGRPRMDALLTWAMAYLDSQKPLGMPLADVRKDDELEGTLRRLMKLKEPQRTKAVQEFYRRWTLAKEVKQVVAGSPSS